MSIQTGNEIDMRQFKFVGRVTSMGKRKLVIIIPTEFYEDAEPFRGEKKRVMVTVDELL
jgi:hypothetical protein